MCSSVSPTTHLSLVSPAFTLPHLPTPSSVSSLCVSSVVGLCCRGHSGQGGLKPAGGVRKHFPMAGGDAVWLDISLPCHFLCQWKFAKEDRTASACWDCHCDLPPPYYLSLCREAAPTAGAQRAADCPHLLISETNSSSSVGGRKICDIHWLGWKCERCSLDSRGVWLDFRPPGGVSTLAPPLGTSLGHAVVIIYESVTVRSSKPLLNDHMFYI